ncbi:hypothetical protein MMC13_004310 [Lambiella insularis]|nr:hypothetical protein [Lambiella insularis]
MGHPHLTCFQSMTTFATTLISKSLKTHHGQSSHQYNSGDMDFELGKASRAEQPAQSDVMNTSVEPSQPPSPAQPSKEDAVTIIAADTALTAGDTYPNHDDTAEAFVPLRLGQKVYAPQQPRPSQDLITLYGLSHLAASVARNDPITGEKVNKMRKSYEGQVKTFGLAGRNKAVKHETGAPGGLVELMNWPEEEWQNQKVFGKELERGLSSATLAKLEKSMKFEPGLVPRNDEWEHVLGLEKLKAPMPLVETKVKAATQAAPKLHKVNGRVNGMTVGIPAPGDVARPKRTGRKRRYDEHSFEGYGEGYVDDDADGMDAGGYSSGEGSRKSNVSKKKRKKEYASINTPGISERGGSYGPGMIHVMSGLGAHQR